MECGLELLRVIGDPVFHRRVILDGALAGLVENVLTFLVVELVIEDVDGRYLSPGTNWTIYERTGVIYSDFPSDWSNIDERDEILNYLEDLKRFAEGVLWREETIMVLAYPIFHIAQPR